MVQLDKVQRRNFLIQAACYANVLDLHAENLQIRQHLTLTDKDFARENDFVDKFLTIERGELIEIQNCLVVKNR